ncbi:RpiB/LacA/LacB family sugar-phosphate isomerase [bacterium]|jgi:ribose 5-phosphate isomerase B|nr:RpiB/LacA/LacB family sugar-phosphate isomerase [bacterium]MBT6831865.1 RpiB/LacA/LacB family sugar-phosphate isomerase [bacterium]MBT6996519.1 RpiB/LacA/LacB family sugar-phosphate isomerase [bacterium]MBT7773012.1 RpiB/LacA/LacB family sugar-phosphate isomerase [bacterium]
MKIFLGSDHGGFELKRELEKFLAEKFPEFEIFDLGCDSAESCDYPQFGRAVAEEVLKNENSRGIVICGSGVGISIAANRVAGARAVLANSVELSNLGRQHNDANILALGGRTKFYDPWQKIVETFLTTDVDPAERHARRRDQLDNF